MAASTPRQRVRVHMCPASAALLCPQVMWHVRSKLQCPPAAAYPPESRWRLEEAAAEMKEVQLEPDEEPPRPDVSGSPKHGPEWRRLSG